MVVCKLNLHVQYLLSRTNLPTHMAAGADDTVTIVIQLILKHLENPTSYATIVIVYDVQS